MKLGTRVQDLYPLVCKEKQSPSESRKTCLLALLSRGGLSDDRINAPAVSVALDCSAVPRLNCSRYGRHKDPPDDFWLAKTLPLFLERTDVQP